MEFDPNHEFAAREHIDCAIREMTIAERGDDALVPHPPHPDAVLRPELALNAALIVQHLAFAHAVRYVADLRGQSLSWRELATVANGHTDPTGEHAEEAFEQFTSGSALFGPARAIWTCAGPDGCGEKVTDHGPYEANPARTETGHGTGCVRHRREVQAVANV